MRIAMIGLGKMGRGMSGRLLEFGHEVVGFDLDEAAVKEMEQRGTLPAYSIEEAVGKLESSPRVVWVMVPAGKPVELVLDTLSGVLEAGDIIIEGGNSLYKDSMRRADSLAKRGIMFLDTGVSGGVWGETEGFNLMTGGDEQAFKKVEPIFAALAPEGGYRHVGPSGAGHFVKMVHNGIEYGVMQAIAEGFELMRAKEEFSLDLAGLARLWENGSVIRSWLMELTANALEEDGDLAYADPYVPDSGEGRWTVLESIEQSVPLPVISLSLQMRFRSRQDDSFAARILAAQRNQFGGHAVRKGKS